MYYQRQLAFGEAVERALKFNYCNFSGRAARSEYWWVVLFSALVSVAVSVAFFWSDTLEMIVSCLFSLYMLLPMLGLGVRRLHDTGRSGWWLLIGFIPLVGQLILIYFMILDSTPGVNKWGDVPNMVER